MKKKLSIPRGKACSFFFFQLVVIFLTSHLGIRLEKVGRIVIFDEVTKMPDERENYEGIVKRRSGAVI